MYFFSSKTYFFFLSAILLLAIYIFSSPLTMSDPWSIITLVYSGRDWGCHGWVEMQECSGQLSLISISLNAHYNIKYSISENVAHFLLVLFTMPVLLPGLTNCPPKGSNSICSPCSVAVYMTSSLSLGKYPDILAQLFWQQQFLPYGVHVLPEKISFRSFVLVAGT